MTGLEFFFIVLGISSLTAQLFRLVDFIERPARTRSTRRRAAAAR